MKKGRHRNRNKHPEKLMGNLDSLRDLLVAPEENPELEDPDLHFSATREAGALAPQPFREAPSLVEEIPLLDDVARPGEGMHRQQENSPEPDLEPGLETLERLVDRVLETRLPLLRQALRDAVMEELQSIYGNSGES